MASPWVHNSRVAYSTVSLAAKVVSTRRSTLSLQSRFFSTSKSQNAVAPAASRSEGDISSVFRSLSGGDEEALPDRFRDVKRSLITDRDALQASWNRLLGRLKEETQVVKEAGSAIIPQINFAEIRDPPETFSNALRRRGVAVIRGIVPEQEARSWKGEVEEYVRSNPSTKAFPHNNPAVFELYWSSPQVRARAHPNMIAAQRFLMRYWHSKDDNARLSKAYPLVYADRLRIRQPGDSGFALGPHIDGGSVERWEKEGYGRGGVFDRVFDGRWEDFDPWEVSTRIEAKTDLYNGAGACSMFRMFQGWLSMSWTKPGEGTLLVNPLFSLATAYYLLRPFFAPRKLSEVGRPGQPSEEFLDPRNWHFEHEFSSAIQGAFPGHSQELNDMLHPHLYLSNTMVHAPEIAPGDYVAWHCDTIHAVDKIHAGDRDSSVMYIPVCPATPSNLEYLARQRDAFVTGFPPPDFPGGVGESKHVGRFDVANLYEHADEDADEDALRTFGFELLDLSAAKTSGEQATLDFGNKV